MGLNEVVAKIQCDISLLIDLHKMGTANIANSKYTLLPYHPHIQYKPASKNLDKLVLDNDILDELDWNDQLYYFPLSTYKKAQPNPIIQAKFNCSEAAFNILAYKGVKNIVTVGIDGGQKYSSEFSYLKPLQNGRHNFDEQFPELNKIIRKHKINYTRL